jgi:hypothetical protein
MRIQTFILISLSLFSCNQTNNFSEQPEKKVAFSTVVFESGFMYQDSADGLNYFRYSQEQFQETIIHTYKLDSIFYASDSGKWVKAQTQNEYYRTFKLLSNKDTLQEEWGYEKNKQIEIRNYLFEDSTIIENAFGNIVVYKFSIPNPPVDGDQTIFFNPVFGLIETYNTGWMGRFTLNKYIKTDQKITDSLLNDLKSKTDFYRKRWNSSSP